MKRPESPLWFRLARRRSAAFTVLAISVLALVVAGCGSSGSSTSESTSGGGENTSSSGGGEESGGEQLKIAWLYYGPKEDKGWSTALSAAEAAVGEAFPENVENVNAENVPYSDQVTQITEQFITQGANVVVDAGGFGELFTKACAKYPDVKCIEVSPQGQLPPNTLGWSPQYWAAEYVAGVAAGLSTESGTTGYIMPYELPLAKGPMNSFALGCQSTDPQCKTRFVITNDYYNPPKENQAANTLIDAGSDVIRAWLNDQAFCTAAEGRNVKAIGEFTDAAAACPQSTITSVTMNFAPFFEEEVQAMIDGTFEAEPLKILPVEGVIELGEWGPGVSDEVKTKTEQALEELGSGKLNPWTGPIKDDSGQVKVPKGETLSQKFIYNEWDWYVNGIQ